MIKIKLKLNKKNSAGKISAVNRHLFPMCCKNSLSVIKFSNYETYVTV